MRYFLGIIICFLTTINVFGQVLTADFSASPLQVCLGESIQFTDLSTPGGSPIIAWTWDFGDGNSAAVQNPTNVYNTPGIYNITLTVQAQSGSSDFEVKVAYVIVNPLPLVDFSLAQTSCSVPFNAAFNNNSSSGAGYSYQWDFGNGQTSTSYTPTGIVYNSVGNYTASLIVTNTNTGCVDSMSINVDVDIFSADIISPITVCLNEPAQIDDNSTVGVNSWSWDFGDGQTSTAQNNSITYGSAGVYQIELIAQNTTTGCQDTAYAQIDVLALPTVDFIVAPSVGCAPLDVAFTNNSVGGVSYEWDFGNGNTSTNQNPANEQYLVNGSYDVSLIVTGANGCTDTLVQIGAVIVSSITAGFMADNVDGCEPLTVQFTDTTVVPNPLDPIITWNWDFGNGNVFSGQVPPVQNYNAGVYNVTLTVTTTSGCAANITYVDYIQVGAIDLVDFTVAPMIECVKTDIQFTDGTVISVPFTPGEVQYDWGFGDGGLSTVQNPLYQYPADTGYFDVSLVVTFRGCQDSITIPQAVYLLAPVSEFFVDAMLFCNPSGFPITVNVADSSTIGLIPDDVEMVWDWGDGSFTNFDDVDVDDADQGSTSHDYLAYGSFTIEQLIINNTTGCSDSTTAIVNIAQIDASFTASNDSVCVGSEVNLINTSTSSEALSSFVYDMGDGNSILGPDSVYAYSAFGTYNVIFTITDAVGCVDSDTLFNMEALALPVANATPSSTAGCAILDVVYTNTSTNQNNGVGLAIFDWTFPDASTATTNNINQTVNYVLTTEGVFSTTLIVTDDFGCVSPPAIIDVEITKPIAAYAVDSVVCNNAPFVAVNGSTGAGPLTYEWFVDAASQTTNQDYNGQFSEVSNLSSVSHNIQMIVTDVNGCMDTLDTIMVVSLPIADFNYSLSSASANVNGQFVCPPVFAQFTDSTQSYGSVTNWSWDFGNGNSSVLQNPMNTYVYSGVYTASLQIVDEFGCIDDTTIVDYLTILGPLAQPSWTFVGDSCNPLYEFYANNQLGVDNIVWTLDDGSIVNDTSSFGHLYNAGSYLPTVIVSDSSGCSVPYTLPLIDVLYSPIIPSFTANPQTVDVDNPVLISDASTGGSGVITDWDWNTGTETFTNFNGTPFNYSWNVPGTYTVLLTVTNDMGCQGSISQVVLVNGDIIVPTAFTPNGDLVHDDWEILYLDAMYPDNQVFVYNQWGSLIYQSDVGDYNGRRWDGTYNGVLLPVESLYFIINLNDGDNSVRTGTVTIILTD